MRSLCTLDLDKKLKGSLEQCRGTPRVPRERLGGGCGTCLRGPDALKTPAAPRLSKRTRGKEKWLCPRVGSVSWRKDRNHCGCRRALGQHPSD